MPAPIHEGHDKAAKRLLRDDRMMADTLVAFVPGEWVADIDFSTLRRRPALPHVQIEHNHLFTKIHLLDTFLAAATMHRFCAMA